MDLQQNLTGSKAIVGSESFAPSAVRYIKLGEGARWAEQAIERGYVPFQYRLAEHEACLAKDWDKVTQQLMVMGRAGGALTSALREIREFYTLPADTLWVTYWNRHVYWTFASENVIATGLPEPEPPRWRESLRGWRSASLAGMPLTDDRLTSMLTQTFSHRGTICKVKAEDYLLRTIRDEVHPIQDRAMTALTQARSAALDIVRALHQDDLETLVDIIVNRSGWARVSRLGKTMPDVDLVIEHLTTGERGWVQVKSRTRQAEVIKNLASFRRDQSCERFIFACANDGGNLQVPDEPGLELWTGERLAELAVNAGLLNWLIQRAH